MITTRRESLPALPVFTLCLIAEPRTGSVKMTRSEIDVRVREREREKSTQNFF